MRLLPALSLTILLAPADAARAESVPDQPVMEIVSFRLAAGASEARFLDAAKGTADALQRQPGFLARSLTRAEDGTWTDHVTWTSLASAQTAADAVMADPSFGPFMALIDGPSVVLRHDPILWQMD